MKKYAFIPVINKDQGLSLRLERTAPDYSSRFVLPVYFLKVIKTVIPQRRRGSTSASRIRAV